MCFLCWYCKSFAEVNLMSMHCINLKLYVAVYAHKLTKQISLWCKATEMIQQLCKHYKEATIINRSHPHTHTHTHTWACTDKKWDLPLTRLARVHIRTPVPSRQCLVKTKKWQKLKMWPRGVLNGMHRSAGAGRDVSNGSDISKTTTSFWIWELCVSLPPSWESVSNEGGKSSMHEVKVAILGTVQLSDMLCRSLVLKVTKPYAQKVARQKEKMQRKKDMHAV